MMDTVYWINVVNRIRVVDDLLAGFSGFVLVVMLCVVAWNWGSEDFWEGEMPSEFRKVLRVVYIVFALSFMMFLFIPSGGELRRMMDEQTGVETAAKASDDAGTVAAKLENARRKPDGYLRKAAEPEGGKPRDGYPGKPHNKSNKPS